MNPIATTPGLYFAVAPRPASVSPLRSDVAGFAGRTRRGPMGPPVRVEGWRGYLREFGGLAADATVTYAIRGYFENGGDVAWVVRLCDSNAKEATVLWEIGKLDAQGKWEPDSPSTFLQTAYRIEATSPGAWANGTRVSIRYRLRGATGKPEVDMSVQAPREPVEYFAGVALYEDEALDNGILLDNVVKEISERSRLIRLIPEGAQPQIASNKPGPQRLDWELELQGGDEGKPLRQDYLDAVKRLGDENEVALIALPDLYYDLGDGAESQEVLTVAIGLAEQLRDRLVLVDVPPDDDNKSDAMKQPKKTIDWVKALRDTGEPVRAAAVYHPRLWVQDPLGSITKPLRIIPPSGHVAGVISRLDRERGAHHTPANAPLFDAVDITQSFKDDEQARFNVEGVNLLRCFPGRGLQVWGGRTLDLERTSCFVAHRRLIHRLVRAIRRVAEPLVFDVNGPELWLALVRAITTVLLEAWRGGALKGVRPDEGFRVRCDEKINPPEERDNGRVLCEIEIAPAAPMEFILLRVALSSEGELEVFES